MRAEELSPDEIRNWLEHRATKTLFDDVGRLRAMYQGKTIEAVLRGEHDAASVAAGAADGVQDIARLPELWLQVHGEGLREGQTDELSTDDDGLGR